MLFPRGNRIFTWRMGIQEYIFVYSREPEIQVSTMAPIKLNNRLLYHQRVRDRYERGPSIMITEPVQKSNTDD